MVEVSERCLKTASLIFGSHRRRKLCGGSIAIQVSCSGVPRHSGGGIPSNCLGSELGSMSTVFDVMARYESVYDHKISSEDFHMLNCKADMIVVAHLIYTGAKKYTLWHGQVLMNDSWALSGRERCKGMALVWPFSFFFCDVVDTRGIRYFQLRYLQSSTNPI